MIGFVRPQDGSSTSRVASTRVPPSWLVSFVSSVTVGMPKQQGPYAIHLDSPPGPAIATVTPSGIIGEGVRIENVKSNVILAATWVITSATGEIVLSS